MAHIKEPVVGVSWTTDTKTSNIYSPQDGTHSSTTFSQSSTLALSSAQLTALKAVANTVTFTCEFTVGDTNIPITATQTINLYTPSELTCLISKSFSRDLRNFLSLNSS